MAVMSKSTHGFCTKTLLWRGDHANHFVVHLQRSEGTGPTLGLLIWFAHLTVDTIL